MTLNDPLSNALSIILSSEKLRRTECLIKPVSRVIKEILGLMNGNGYVGKFEEIKDNKGNYLKLQLLGAINKCGAIKPRYSVKKDNFEKFEKRYLPAKDIGMIVVSTPRGIMPHFDAKKKAIGGRLLAYCY